MQQKATEYRLRNIHCWEQDHIARIIDFDFKPSALVLIRNSCTVETLSRKTKPRYLGPMVAVRKTKGSSYIVAELDGAQSQLRTAAYRLIPYLPRERTELPIIPNLSEGEQGATYPDPEEFD